MTYKKILSGAYFDSDRDLYTTIRFLEDKFGAVHHEHPGLDKLVELNDKIWWVIPSTDRQELDICRGKDCDRCKLLKDINRAHSGILILRQMEGNRICIYLVEDLEELERRCKSSLAFRWSTIDHIKSFSEIGVVIGGDLIGFKKLRNLRIAS